MFFVYRKNTRGSYSPEKWREKSAQLNGKTVHPDAVHELKRDEITLPLAVLERIYPPPKDQPPRESPGDESTQGTGS